MKTVAVLSDGAFSALLWNGRPFAVSVEHTFGQDTVLKNGIYPCIRDYYHKGGYETFEIIVEGHDRVLFHKGNTEDDSRGCVIVGESFGELSGKLAVLDSRGGFNEFMELTKEYKQFNLTVTGRADG